MYFHGRKEILIGKSTLLFLIFKNLNITLDLGVALRNQLLAKQ
jgi:hypothetical protein